MLKIQFFFLFFSFLFGKNFRRNGKERNKFRFEETNNLSFFAFFLFLLNNLLVLHRKMEFKFEETKNMQIILYKLYVISFSCEELYIKKKKVENSRELPSL